MLVNWKRLKFCCLEKGEEKCVIDPDALDKISEN